MHIVAWPAGTKPYTNPYCRNLYTAVKHTDSSTEVSEASARRLRRRHDVLHVHWPEDFAVRRRGRRAARLLLVLAALAFAKKRGAMVVWTAHNPLPHERTSPQLESFLYQGLAAVVDGVIHPSRASRDRFRLAHGDKFAAVPQATIPLGTFAPADDLDHPPSAPRTLGSHDTAILGCVGQIRGYKKMVEFAAEVAASRCPIRLVVAGPPVDLAVVDALAQLAPTRVEVDARWLSDHELTNLVDGLDAAVFNYRDSINSSAALLALSRHRRVVGLTDGPVAELQDHVGPDWVMLVAQLNRETLADVVSWLQTSPQRPPRLHAFSWDRIARDHLDFYEVLRRRRGQAAPHIVRTPAETETLRRPSGGDGV